MSHKNPDTVPWVCAQLGSRENYAIPSSLRDRGQLQYLLTDFWSQGKSLLPFTGNIANKVKERKHPNIPNQLVHDLGYPYLISEYRLRKRKLSHWTEILKRNDQYQAKHLAFLNRHKKEFIKNPGIFFTFSYAGLHLMKFFKELGWSCFLGQIDPGPQEEKIVGEIVRTESKYATDWEAAPKSYWDSWREECNIADAILVNSEWSKTALAHEGIDSKKIEILPLAYEKTASVQSAKSYPNAFTTERPLRVLFLGQVILRKGIHLLLEAAKLLSDQPIEFWLVGPDHLNPNFDRQTENNVKWIGSVSRSKAMDFYKDADLFILPTLSDGFALTQLEALKYKLPLLCSKFCGKVVQLGINGDLIDPLNVDTLVQKLKTLIYSGDTLRKWSENCMIKNEFSLDQLTKNLVQLEQQFHLQQ